MLLKIAWTLVTIILCPFFGLYYFVSGGIKGLIEFAKDNTSALEELWKRR